MSNRVIALLIVFALIADSIASNGNNRDTFYVLYVFNMVIMLIFYMYNKKREAEYQSLVFALADAFNRLDGKIDAVYKATQKDE